MVALHIWSAGLALVVEAGSRRAATVFDADGWRLGDAGDMLPSGPPSDAESAALGLPSWLTEQMVGLPVSQGLMHTDFVKLDRLTARLQAQGTDGVLLVLGAEPAAAVYTAGTCTVVVPPDAGASASGVLTRARGWIVLLTGAVALPAVATDVSQTAATAQAPAEPALVEAPPDPAIMQGPRKPAMVQPTLEPAAVEVPPEAGTGHAPLEPAPAPAVPSGGDERFIASSGMAVPDDVAAELRAIAGDAGVSVVTLLDGTRTVAEVAAATGLSAHAAAAVIKLLVSRKLAFRYVSRVRPASGVRGPR